MIQSTNLKTFKKKNFIKEGHLRLRFLLRTQGGFLHCPASGWILCQASTVQGASFFRDIGHSGINLLLQKASPVFHLEGRYYIFLNNNENKTHTFNGPALTSYVLEWVIFKDGREICFKRRTKQKPWP